MSDNAPAPQAEEKDPTDGSADAIAVVAVMTIVIGTLCFWLAGMPS
ncbi:hypothetical protein [Candidatus Litorirhabdus singularis]|nr:hypothetical protein [Candidatus Litorirhabdus singularis]